VALWRPPDVGYTVCTGMAGTVIARSLVKWSQLTAEPGVEET